MIMQFVPLVVLVVLVTFVEGRLLLARKELLHERKKFEEKATRIRHVVELAYNHVKNNDAAALMLALAVVSREVAADRSGGRSQ